MSSLSSRSPLSEVCAYKVLACACPPSALASVFMHSSTRRECRTAVHKAYVRVCVCGTAAAFLTQTVTLEDATVKFEIWDTAGQGAWNNSLLRLLVFPACTSMDSVASSCTECAALHSLARRKIPFPHPYVLSRSCGSTHCL
jgi:hypothetical protein